VSAVRWGGEEERARRRGGAWGRARADDDRGSKVARWVSMQLQSHYVELLLWCGRKWKAPIKNAFNWRDINGY
jgi:hypothetical protein